jgi:superfamily II DNA or RNA helicase
LYGLTATPVRKDGHHPIITMQCGKIRFRDDEKKQAAKRPFNHYIIPRFTDFQLIAPIGTEDDDMSITKLYAKLISDNSRNQMIINDIISSV